MADTIEIEVLEDGTISIKTSAISGVNHISADKLVTEIEELLGGETKVTHRKQEVRVHKHTQQHHHH